MENFEKKIENIPKIIPLDLSKINNITINIEKLINENFQNYKNLVN